MENKLNVDQVEDEAATWILRREESAWSRRDEAALQAWLAAATNHRVAYARLRCAWRQAQRLEVVNTAKVRGAVPARDAIWQSPLFVSKKRPVPENNDIPRRAFPASLQWVAGVLLVVSVGIGVYLSFGGAPSYRTPIGGMASVPLEDGSKITLNTDSEIALKITAQERRIELKRGEAFFEVAQDAKRPFVVYADDQRVVAVGTKFAVRIKPEAVQVAVTEGLVRLESRTVSAPAASVKSLPLLTPGTIASARDQQVSIQQKPLENLEQVLSWRTGYVVLQRALLTEAVEEFNRYNSRQLVIADPALADVVVGGNFRADNLDGFVRLLQNGFQVRAREEGRRIILTRR